MRIVENRPDRLILRDRSVVITGVCLAAAAAITLMAARYGGPPQLVPALMFAGFGLVFFNVSDAAFDRKARTVRLRRISVRGVSHTVLRFDEIDEARVETSTTAGGGHGALARLALIKDGRSYPLTTGYGPGLERHEAMRAAIAGALGGKAAAGVGDCAVETLVRQRRMIDAIRLLRAREGLDLAAAHQRVTAMARHNPQA